jgi:uncharacterized protein
MYRTHRPDDRVSGPTQTQTMSLPIVRISRLASVASLTLTGAVGCARTQTTDGKAPVDSAAYAADTKTWRAQRLDAIAGADGWSTVAGLHWLDGARYTIGTTARDSIALTPGHAPRAVGEITRRDSGLHFITARGGTVMVDTTRVDSVVLMSDKSGRATVLRTGSVTLRVIERGGRLALRVKDSLATLRTDFKGLEYYPLDTSWRVQARLIPHATPRGLRIMNVLGQEEEYRSPGVIEFSHGGVAYTLTAAHEPNDDKLFIIFRDPTSRDSTYPAGRFLYAAPADSAGLTLLDFNRAYNPPCAFTPHATCPLPPAENMLKGAIRAGEVRYKGPHGATLEEVRSAGARQP